MSEQSLPTRPAEPPQVCGRCSNQAPARVPVVQPPPPPKTEWHCPNQRCTWVTCLGCRGLTDVAGLLPGRGDQKQ